MSGEAEKETLDYVPGKQSASRFFGPVPRLVRVAFGATSHPGKVRPTNEDHYVVVRRRRSRTVLLSNVPAEALLPSEEDAYALLVADGMGGVAFIGHVGDSRAYLHRRGAVHQVTRDHTLAQELADAGMPNSETAEFGHVLTWAAPEDIC